MQSAPRLPAWTIAAPLVGWILLAVFLLGPGDWYALLAAVGLCGAVLAAVHHAEVVAHRVGEPYGTLVLAAAVTVIELALIVSLMLSGGETAASLARDTVFATVMIILNGIVGACMLVGSSRHGEPEYSLRGANAALATLAAIVTLTLVLPNYTTPTPGPVYSVRPRDYFLPPGSAEPADQHTAPPSGRRTLASVGLLFLCLGAVVLLAKAISPALESALDRAGAPKVLVGVVIAAVVLLPEAIAALRAARANRLQTSLNLALGSALATIGLTIPGVSV